MRGAEAYIVPDLVVAVVCRRWGHGHAKEWLRRLSEERRVVHAGVESGCV